MLEQLDLFYQRNRETHLEEFKQFVSISSVSTSHEHVEDILACASFTAELLRKAGLERVELLETTGYPIVYGELIHDPEKPTVLVYGHYDVQPSGAPDLWISPPFKPEIRDGKFFGRGASDNKGQIFLHIKTIEAFLHNNLLLPFNVKFCIEGEEEIGSPSFSPYLTEHPDRFQADLIVISDTAILGEDQPAVCYGLRGLVGFQLDVHGPKHDLPSGAMYGGAVQNPIHALVHLLSSMHDEQGRITIKGFYEDVLPVTDQERATLAQLPFDEQEMMERLEVPTLFGEKGYSTLERAWARPTLEVNGISGGYQGEGSMTIIPSNAQAKVTCRIVPNQDPEKLLTLIQDHVDQHTLPGVTVTVIGNDAAWPYVSPLDHPVILLAAEAYEYAFKAPCYHIRAGGSIPIVEIFSRLFQVPIVLMGFGLPTGNVHGPNEHFSLGIFDKGLRTLSYFWMNLDRQL